MFSDHLNSFYSLLFNSGDIVDCNQSGAVLSDSHNLCAFDAQANGLNAREIDNKGEDKVYQKFYFQTAKCDLQTLSGP